MHEGVTKDTKKEQCVLDVINFIFIHFVSFVPFFVRFVFNVLKPGTGIDIRAHS